MHVRVVREVELEPAATLGERLAQVRQAAGFTQTHMARVIGRSVRHVKSVEANQAEISARGAWLWAQQCGCMVSDLLIEATDWFTAQPGAGA